MDAGFVLALPFYYRDLEPDCVGASTRGAYARDGNTSARLCTKNAGGTYARGGAYLWDTTVQVQNYKKSYDKTMHTHTIKIWQL